MYFYKRFQAVHSFTLADISFFGFMIFDNVSLQSHIHYRKAETKRVVHLRIKKKELFSLFFIKN